MTLLAVLLWLWRWKLFVAAVGAAARFVDWLQEPR
jgi:hypothetical protein